MSNRKYRPGTTTATHQGEPSSPEYLVKKAETPMEAFQRLFFDGGDNVISMEELIRDPKGALHLMLDQFDVAVDEQAQQADHHQQKRDEALAKLGQTKQLREVIAGMYQKVGGDEPVVKAPVTKLITKPLVASPPPSSTTGFRTWRVSIRWSYCSSRDATVSSSVSTYSGTSKRT